MAMGSPEWIEESLARLERMEQERDRHEKALEATADADALSHHSESIDRLDEEIRQLYAALEQVAEDEPDDDESTEAADEVVQTHPFGREAAPPAPPTRHLDDDEPAEDPFGVPVSAPATPSMPTAYAPGPLSSDVAYDTEPTGGGSAKWVVLLVVLVAGGGGGFVWWKNNQPAPAPPPMPTEAKVIDATAVPDDTQGPRGAQGQEGVTRTPEREFGSSRRSGGGGGRPSRGSGASGKKTKGDGKAIELKSGGDPLG